MLILLIRFLFQHILQISETSQLQKDVLSVTVIYLYTYPTLLIQLIPLLSELFKVGRLRAIVTLTYHIHRLQQSTSPNTGDLDFSYDLERVNEEHDLCLYTNISLRSTSDVSKHTEHLE